MKRPPFCTNPNCPLHNPKEVKKRNRKKIISFYKNGTHYTSAFGFIQRFICTLCKTTCSTQSFSLDYYAKRKISYKSIVSNHNSCTNIRASSRLLNCSTGTISNRLMRFSRQCIAVETLIRDQITLAENIVVDGFESYVNNQYHPNNINIAVGSESNHIYAQSYTQLNRKGSMTTVQKKRAKILKESEPIPLGHMESSFRHLCIQLENIKHSTKKTINLYSDKNSAYRAPIEKMGSSFSHFTISSHDPRVQGNPLQPVNYSDREFRKDLAEHVRETVCHGRDTNCQLERMSCYIFYHNYWKQFRINDPVSRKNIHHSDIAGISKEVVTSASKNIFTKRLFISHIYDQLSWYHLLLWFRLFKTPEKESAQYLPKFLINY